MELDSGANLEALTNHPTKWDSSQAIPRVIRDRSPTNVYKRPDHVRTKHVASKQGIIYRSDIQQTKLPSRWSHGVHHRTPLQDAFYSCDRVGDSSCEGEGSADLTVASLQA
jgi:hypothetical protein